MKLGSQGLSPVEMVTNTKTLDPRFLGVSGNCLEGERGWEL
jgi:hypothetical protein